MQKQNQIFVATIFLVVLLSLFHSGKAIKCYECPKQGEKSCPDKLTDNEAHECETVATACIKFTMEIEGEKLTGRSCGVSGACKKAKEIFNLKDCVECTDKDLCNGSAANAASIVMMLTSGVVALLWTTQ